MPCGQGLLALSKRAVFRRQRPQHQDLLCLGCAGPRKPQHSYWPV